MLAWVLNLGFAGSQAAPPVIVAGVSSSTVSESTTPGGTQFHISGAHISRDTGVTKKLP